MPTSEWIFRMHHRRGIDDASREDGAGEDVAAADGLGDDLTGGTEAPCWAAVRLQFISRRAALKAPRRGDEIHLLPEEMRGLRRFNASV
jgi:hypothetical protein